MDTCLVVIRSRIDLVKLILYHVSFVPVISDNGFCLIQLILILHTRLIKVNNCHSTVDLIDVGYFIYVL
jgi:hypothetical protein